MIANLRHRILLCAQKDVVTVNGELHLNREGVLTAWAGIENKAASAFNGHGAALADTRNKRTHVITMRCRPDVNLTDLAWFYEERRLSSPRWFKILKYTESEMGGSAAWMVDVRLVERGDDAAQPTEADESVGAHPLPDGVDL